ncbi:hypothetical protein B0H63DRAFT_537967 [Podospora didyma]|uniref:Uncharacterized protein n=1 Tax=Podospora didyma TaxID=330526 RepID=A0AAE0U441_9PEZI|nr:hypothetical protein B0H63DRAFT_537967 [Podospora didyma]
MSSDISVPAPSSWTPIPASDVANFNLPRGGIGFFSTFITVYALLLLSAGRSPLLPWRKLRLPSVTILLCVVWGIFAPVLNCASLARLSRAELKLIVVGEMICQVGGCLILAMFLNLFRPPISFSLSRWLPRSKSRETNKAPDRLESGQQPMLPRFTFEDNNLSTLYRPPRPNSLNIEELIDPPGHAEASQKTTAAPEIGRCSSQPRPNDHDDAEMMYVGVADNPANNLHTQAPTTLPLVESNPPEQDPNTANAPSAPVTNMFIPFPTVTNNPLAHSTAGTQPPYQPLFPIQRPIILSRREPAIQPPQTTPTRITLSTSSVSIATFLLLTSTTLTIVGSTLLAVALNPTSHTAAVITMSFSLFALVGVLLLGSVPLCFRRDSNDYRRRWDEEPGYETLMEAFLALPPLTVWSVSCLFVLAVTGSLWTDWMVACAFGSGIEGRDDGKWVSGTEGGPGMWWYFALGKILLLAF